MSASPPHHESPTTALVGGLGAAAVVALACWSFWTASSTVVATSSTRAEAVGRDLVAEANAHLLDMLPSLFPDPGAVSSWTAHGSALAELHDQLEGAAQRHGFTSVRTLHLLGDAAERVRSTPDLRQPRALTMLVSNAPTPSWGRTADYLPEMEGAWLEGATRSRFASSKRSGATVTTWIPVPAPSGRTVAVIELRENVDAALFTARCQSAGLVALAGLVAGLLTWITNRGVRDRLDAPAPIERPLPAAPAPNPLVAATGALAQLEAGDFDTPIRTADAALTRGLERLRESLLTTVQASLDRAIRAESRLRSAESLLDPRTTQRRDAIAALGEAPLLTLDVGGGRRADAWLVDLHFSALVVRVAPYSVVDLATGMPAQVEWSDGSGQPFALILNRRCDTEAGVEYTFDVPPGKPLPFTPEALVALAYSRSTPRVSAEFLDVTGVLLAGHDGVLAVQVVDISADGVRVQVAAPPAELAASGTRITLVLQLAADEPELEFAVIVRSVRESELGCYAGLEFDLALTRDLEASRGAVQAWVDARLRAEREGQEGDAAA